MQIGPRAILLVKIGKKEKKRKGGRSQKGSFALIG